MEPRHDGPDRDLEDLRRVRVAEVADVDEHDHVPEVVRHRRKGRNGIVLREPIIDAILRRAAVLLELVVEEVVALLERLQIGRALDAPAAVDVQVGQDPEQPGTQVRSRRVGTPRAESPRVRLLHQVLRFLPRGHEPPCDTVHLVGQVERFLLEANAVARLLGELPRIGFGRHVAHRGHPS